MKDFMYIAALMMIGAEIGEESIEELEGMEEEPVSEPIITYDDNYIDSGDNNIWEDHLQNIEEDMEEDIVEKEDI